MNLFELFICWRNSVVFFRQRRSCLLFCHPKITKKITKWKIRLKNGKLLNDRYVQWRKWHRIVSFRILILVIEQSQKLKQKHEKCIDNADLFKYIRKEDFNKTDSHHCLRILCKVVRLFVNVVIFSLLIWSLLRLAYRMETLCWLNLCIQITNITNLNLSRTIK